MKTFRVEEEPEDLSWSHFFTRGNFKVSAQNFQQYFTWYYWKISYFLSANHNPELRFVIYTGVTLFALVLHLNCTALTRSESRIFFHVYCYSCKWRKYHFAGVNIANRTRKLWEPEVAYIKPRAARLSIFRSVCPHYLMLRPQESHIRKYYISYCQSYYFKVRNI